MRSGLTSVVSLALACQGALANWLLTAQESYGEKTRHRVWYGDGRAYIGQVVPDDVETAFNITINNFRSELLVIEPDTSLNPSSSDALDAPTFMTLDFRPGAAAPIRFVHSARDLTHDDKYMFAVIDGYYYPTDRSGLYSDLSMGAFMLPTDTNGTYVFHWFDSDVEAAEAGGTRVGFSMRFDEEDYL